MKNDVGFTKIGYQKVKKLLAKAWQAGLRYGWIHTCCIDKSSSAELSEAINSVFQWYKEAAYCYVYFSDLPGHPSKLLKQDLGVKLRPCRWFRRGWTLQEFLAPSHLIFYSQDWQSIGDGEYLKDIISSITGIHAEALKNDPNKLSKFSIAQRMSWASKRQTTRIEDMTYCLMGIFDVNMPLLYGEGNKAFARLQEQIAKDSDDQTIFCWYHKRWPGEIEETTSSFLAYSPRDFQESSTYLPVRTGKVHPYEITNAGLRITGRLQEGGNNRRLLLHCYDEDRPQTFLKLPLKRIGQDGDQFFRISGMLNRDFNNNNHRDQTI